MHEKHDTKGGDRGEIKEFRLLEVQSKPTSLQMSLFANGEFHGAQNVHNSTPFFLQITASKH
jgi:hypothetical protein